MYSPLHHGRQGTMIIYLHTYIQIILKAQKHRKVHQIDIERS